MTANNIQILLEIYVMPYNHQQYHVRRASKRGGSSLARLAHRGFIAPRAEPQGTDACELSRWDITEKGTVYIEALCKVKTPVQHWRVPK